MPKLDTNLSAFAQVSGGRTMRGDSPSATEARQLLRDFRAGLVGEDGSVSSGYLSINRKSGGGVAMETRGRHQWGSWHTDKKDAAKFIRHLISTGYGSELSTQTTNELNRELSSYLGKTQDRFGTQSFVRLVDKLEKELNPDKVVLPAPATIAAKTSVKAQFHVVSRATEDATNRLQAIKAKFKTVDQLGPPLRKSSTWPRNRLSPISPTSSPRRKKPGPPPKCSRSRSPHRSWAMRMAASAAWFSPE
jgi:hypothetical protein